MIANITKGRRAYGGLAYDFGPGRQDEHLDPHIVAGNIPGTWQQVARMIDHHTGHRPEIRKAVWRCSLSLPDEDGVLPDKQWAQMAEQFVADMGFENCGWVAVRHGDDHVHITVSRLDWDGVLVTDRWDRPRARRVCDAIERRHGLVAARSRFKETGPGVQSGSELAAAQRRGAELPEREQIRVLVRQARQQAAGQGEAAFEARLDDLGVLYRANRASTGRMNGYSFSLPSWVKPDGVGLWAKASEVAPDLAWKKLAPVLGPGPTPPSGPPLPPRPRADGRPQEEGDQVEERRTARPGDVAGHAPTDPANALLRHYRQQARPAVEEDRVEEDGDQVVDEQLPADPAQALLRHYVAAAQQLAEEPVLEEPTDGGDSTGGDGEPPVEPWTERPHGAMTDQQLQRRLKQARGDAQDSLAALAARREEVVRWQQAQRGEGGGPGSQRLDEQLAQLTEAVRLHGEVDRHRQEADAAQAVITEQDAVQKAAAKKAKRPNAVLVLTGTTKAAQRKVAEDAGEKVEVAIRQRDAARRAQAQALDSALAAAPGVRDPQTELIRMTTQWPQLQESARRDDRGLAGAWLETAHTAALAAEQRLQRAVATVQPLEAEARIRAALTPEQAAAENTARAQARRSSAATGRSTTVKGKPKPSPQDSRQAEAQRIIQQQQQQQRRGPGFGR